MTGFNNLNQFQDPDYNGFFLGTVKFNNDPEKRQRVKVSIPKLLDGNVDDLPWVTPILQSPFGMTSNAGVMSVPVLGALVVVQFQGGELYYGLLVGSMHSADHTPNPALLLNYPKRRGWADPVGNLFWIDTTSGSVETHYQHPSGTYIHINNAGQVTVSSPVNVIVNCLNATVTASQNATVNGNNVNVNGTTSLNLTAPEIYANGNFNLTGNMLATGTFFKHNGKRVGSDHTHGGVRFGSDISADPTFP